MRFIGRRDGVLPGAARADATGPRRRPAATTGSRCSSPSTTAAGRRSSTRRERFTGGTEEEFRKLLYAPEMHDPDLIIRTSGEQRLSNYLLWQSAYSELHFTDVLWPDFSRDGLRGRARRVRGAPAPLRRPLMASAAAAGSVAAPRRAAPGASDLVRGSWSRSRRSRSRSSSSPTAAGSSRSAILVLGCVCLHELFRMLERGAAGPAGGDHRRSPGCRGGAARRTSARCCSRSSRSCR